MARVEKFWESSPMTSDRTSTLNIIELYCMCLTRVTSFAKKRTQITEFRRFVHAQVPKSSANRVVGPSRRPVERVLSTVTRLELPTVPSRVLFQRNSAHRAIDGYHPFFFIRSTSGLSSLPNPLSGAPEGFSHCDGAALRPPEDLAMAHRYGGVDMAGSSGRMVPSRIIQLVGVFLFCIKVLVLPLLMRGTSCPISPPKWSRVKTVAPMSSVSLKQE